MPSKKQEEIRKANKGEWVRTVQTPFSEVRKRYVDEKGTVWYKLRSVGKTLLHVQHCFLRQIYGEVEAKKKIEETKIQLKARLRGL